MEIDPRREQGSPLEAQNPPPANLPPSGRPNPPQVQTPPNPYRPGQNPYGQPWIYGTPLSMLQMQQKNEKKRVRSDAGKAISLVCGLELALQSLVSVVMIVYMAFSELTGYTLPEPVYVFAFNYLPIILLEALAIIIGLFWFQSDVKSYFRKPTLQKGEGWKIFGFSAIALGVMQLGSLIYLLYYYLFSAFGVDLSLPMFETDSSNWLVNVMVFSYAVVFGPIMEEILFRGLLFHKLRRYGDMPAILLTAILFAMLHMNFVQLPGPLLFGVAVGIIMSKTNSIWPCIGVHIFNNLFAMLSGYMSENAANIYETLLMIIYFAAGIVCFILLFKDIKAVFLKHGDCRVLSVGQKFGAMLNNAWFYVFFALWLVISVTTHVMA